MHISVEGQGIKTVIPNEITLLLDFSTKAKNYDEAFTKGTKSVVDFIDKILIPNGFKSDDLKTKSFTIKNVDEYNQATNKMEFSHYLFRQQAFLKMPYDINLLSKLLSQTAFLENPPLLKLEFTNSNIEEFKSKALELAYNDSLEKAKVIATAAGKVIKEIIKVDYKPIIIPLSSPTIFDQDVVMFKEASANASTINQIFTPADIEVRQNLYSLFLAE